MQPTVGVARALVRKPFIGALLLAALSATAYVYYVPHEHYYPVAKIAAPGGVVFTAFLDGRRGIKQCTAANAELLVPVARECRQCKVLFAQCLEKAKALELTLQAGEAAHQYWVVSQGVTIAVGGVETSARASCEAVAADLASKGMRSQCIYTSAMSKI
jgi:hypothetical protein